MYNPIPHLPEKFQSLIRSMKSGKLPPRLIFFVIGSLATIWFLVRVIPKPSRAAYPCMQATAPFMSGFVLYLLSLGGAFSAFRRARTFFSGSKYSLALLFLGISGLFYLLSHTFLPLTSKAGNGWSGRSYFTPNAPIGQARGIFPGRVVWMWDPRATNENCTNTSNGNGVIDPGDDAWFMAKNNNETIIDSMIIRSVMALTGAPGNAGAWDSIFRFYNKNHGKGNTGYSPGQKIFIKINATTAYGGLADGRFHADLSRTDILSVNAFSSETNPYVVLTLLRQLVNVAGVPQDLIMVGDPARNIYREFYDLWHAEFPGVKILGNNLIHTELNITGLGRTPVAVTPNDRVFFSDHGTVMPDAVTDKLFTVSVDADYMINVPAMKAHATGGITLAAKDHFGSFTREWAMHLHPGLMGGVDAPTRLGYGLYRVQTDIMMHNLLGGKTLLIVVDGLYPSDDALAVPLKWSSVPFGNDWCSSIFMSLDPVAVESVCHDFLRTEYNGPTVATSRPNWFGVDDYLHQAADSSLWPANITYDPDNDGILFASLGVHEHWNDSLLKQYTRNLGTGDGIELYKVHEHVTGMNDITDQHGFRAYPNPADGHITLANPFSSRATFTVTGLDGKRLLEGTIERNSGKDIRLDRLGQGVYLVQIRNAGAIQNIKFIKQ